MTRSTTFSASVRRNRVLVGGVVTLAVVTALLSAMLLGRGPATADEPQPTPTPAPTAPETPEPTDEPSDIPVPSQPPFEQPSETPAPAPSEPAGPQPVIQAPDGVLPLGGVIRVTVDGLRLREGPGLDAETRLVLTRGELLTVGFPFANEAAFLVEKDGFIWVAVSHLGLTELPALGGDPLGRPGEYGFIAVRQNGDDFVELLAPRCVEGDPDLQTLGSMTPWERLACLGNRSITLEGVAGCGGCGGYIAGTYEPSWIANPMNYNFLSVEPTDRLGPVVMHFGPNGPEAPEDGTIIRVTGHFDDAASAKCEIAQGEPDPRLVDQVQSELYCSTQFVVEGYEVLGTHPNWPWS